MKIQWNKVTWYSKLLAVVVFLATLAIGFCLGRQFEALRIERRDIRASSKILLRSTATDRKSSAPSFDGAALQNVSLKNLDGKNVVLEKGIAVLGSVGARGQIGLTAPYAVYELPESRLLFGTIAENGGGSGTFVSVGLWLEDLRKASKPEFVGSVLVGDRIEVKSIDASLARGFGLTDLGVLARVHYLDRKSTDSYATTPTVPVQKDLLWSEGVIDIYHPAPIVQ